MYRGWVRRSPAHVLAPLLILPAATAESDARTGKHSAPTRPRGRPRGLTSPPHAQVYQGHGTVMNHCEVPGSAEVSGRIRGRRSAYVLGAAPWGTAGGIGGVRDETLAGPLVAYEQYREVFGPLKRTRLIKV